MSSRARLIRSDEFEAGQVSTMIASSPTASTTRQW
jgi:hypothetical protein